MPTFNPDWGSSPDREFITVDRKGKFSKLRYAVFPIFIERDSKFHFLASGFFISITGIFITASHAINDFISSDFKPPKYKLHIAELLPEEKYRYRQITFATYLSNSDICVGVSSAPIDEKGRIITNSNVVLGSKTLDIGSDIFTYAYPDTQISSDKELTVIDAKPKFYKGIIKDYFPHGRDRVLLPSPCYQSNIAIHSGASGGPVFCATSGVVIGLNSSSYENEPNLSFISKIPDIQNVEVPDGSPNKMIKLERLIETGRIAIER